MKKIFLLLTLLFTANSIFANHALGGEITWECAGNGNYVFQVVRYNDCSDLQSMGTAVSLNWNGGAAITCTAVDTSFISPQCYNPTFTINCDSTYAFTPVLRYVYRSAPVVIPSIPATGYHFWFNEQARPDTDNLIGGGTNGYIFRAVMYPYSKNGQLVSPTECYDNSPQFVERPRYAFGTNVNDFYVDGADPDSQDSVYFEWASPWNYGTSYPGTAIAYESGYSASQPIPGPLFNIQNTGATLYPNGNITFASQTTGRFTICYKIESWRDGQRISEVYRDFEMQIESDPGSPGLCSSGGNNAPLIGLGYYANFDTLKPIYSNAKIIGYSAEVLAGEQVKFNILAQDADLNSNCAPQNITATATGAAMSNTLLASGSCVNGPCATLSSLNSNGSFVSALNNVVRFDWATDTAHAQKEAGFGVHTFFVNMADNHCVLPGESQLMIQIKVLRPIYASAYNLRVCAGDTAQVTIKGDVSNLSWGSAQNISCNTCANPKFYPTSTTTYTVTDLNTGYQFTITVEVDPALPAPQFGQVGNDLVFNNVAAYDTVIWQRNFAPFYPDPTNSYTPRLNGAYWVASQGGACVVESQHIDFWFGDNLTTTIDSAGEWFDNRSASLTHGLTFRLQQEPWYTLDGLYLHAFSDNQQGDLSAMSAKIWDQQLNLVFQSDSVVRITPDIIKFYGEATLATGQDYLMGIYTDTSLTVPTFKPEKWPVVANQGRVFVFNATNAVGNTIPTNNAPDYPFVNFSLKWHVGIPEKVPATFETYPNPANEVLYIAAPGKGIYTLCDIRGSLVVKGEIDRQADIDVVHFSPGIYLLTIYFEDGSSAVKKVVVE